MNTIDSLIELWLLQRSHGQSQQSVLWLPGVGCLWVERVMDAQVVFYSDGHDQPNAYVHANSYAAAVVHGSRWELRAAGEGRIVDSVRSEEAGQVQLSKVAYVNVVQLIGGAWGLSVVEAEDLYNRWIDAVLYVSGEMLIEGVGEFSATCDQEFMVKNVDERFVAHLSGDGTVGQEYILGNCSADAVDGVHTYGHQHTHGDHSYGHGPQYVRNAARRRGVPVPRGRSVDSNNTFYLIVAVVIGAAAALFLLYLLFRSSYESLYNEAVDVVTSFVRSV